MKLFDLPKIVYVAGRYSDSDTLPAEEQAKNRKIMQDWSNRVFKAGYGFINPIENDLFMQGQKDWDYQKIMQMDFALIMKADIFFLCPGWSLAPFNSGVKREYRFALRNNLKIMFWHDLEEEDGAT